MADARSNVGDGFDPLRERVADRVFGDEPHPLQVIAEEGGSSAVGLVGSLMEHSARERESIEESLREADQKEIEYWRTRALKAEDRIDRIHDRVFGLLS